MKNGTTAISIAFMGILSTIAGISAFANDYPVGWDNFKSGNEFTVTSFAIGNVDGLVFGIAGPTEQQIKSACESKSHDQEMLVSNIEANLPELKGRIHQKTFLDERTNPDVPVYRGDYVCRTQVEVDSDEYVLDYADYSQQSFSFIHANPPSCDAKKENVIYLDDNVMSSPESPMVDKVRICIFVRKR